MSLHASGAVFVSYKKRKWNLEKIADEFVEFVKKGKLLCIPKKSQIWSKTYRRRILLRIKGEGDTWKVEIKDISGKRLAPSVKEYMEEVRFMSSVCAIEISEVTDCDLWSYYEEGEKFAKMIGADLVVFEYP